MATIGVPLWESSGIGRRSFLFSNSRWKGSFRSVWAASEGGHTLRSHDLGMILASPGDCVCDGGYSADVMNKEG